MEKSEKALLDELKFFDFNNLYQKGSYIDFCFQNFWTQGYILKIRQNNKYDLSFLYHPNDTKDIDDINYNHIGFFGEHSYKNDIDTRNVIFNKDLCNNSTEVKQIYQLLKLKLKKSNLELDFENKEKKKTKNKECEKNNMQIKTEETNDKDKKEEENKNKKENNEEKEKQIEQKKLKKIIKKKRLKILL